MASAFQTPVDIANRALQHVGGRRIVALTDNSRNASEIAACYDQLRQAELRRNCWRFALRLTAIAPLTSTTFFIQPAAWSSTVIYPQGAIVADTSGNWWISVQGNNVGNTPGVYTKGIVPVWQPYFGPMTADIFQISGSGTTSPPAVNSYYTGQIVYENPGQGIVNVYASMENGNSIDPSTAATWSSTVNYTAGDVVIYGGFYYMSLFNFNLNNVPSSSDAQWQSTITYAIGKLVCGYDGNEYQSLVAGNINNNPITDNGLHWGPTGKKVPWAAQFSGSIANGNGWVSLPGMNLDPATFVYPIGAGPIDDIDTINVFPLPAGYLRRAPLDPKEGMIAWLGGPTGYYPPDYVFTDKFFTSQTATPIVFRFVADMQDVASFDPMFCEALAARIAIEVCETLTQDPEKLQACRGAYSQAMAMAAIENAIEEDFETIPEDEFVSVRI